MPASRPDSGVFPGLEDLADDLTPMVGEDRYEKLLTELQAARDHAGWVEEENDRLRAEIARLREKETR